MLPDAFKSLISAENPALLCKIAAARTSTRRHVAPVSSVATKTRAMQRWIRSDDVPELEAVQDPFGLRTAMAIGGSPQSASHLAIAVRGPYAGCVFQVDHGGMPDGPLADSFFDLLVHAAQSPVAFLKAGAAYPRYADGRTAILWEPIDFSLTGQFPA